MKTILCGCFVFTFVTLLSAQVPPRLSIPGAVLVGQARQLPPQGFRQGRLFAPDNNPPPQLRLRRPNAIPIPIRDSAPIRPVVEEPEEPSSPQGHSVFDDEVNKLGLSALTSAVRQATSDEHEEPPVRNVVFRPERPIPVLRQDIRETIANIAPVTIRPVRPVQRQEAAPRPIPRDENYPQARQQSRQQAARQHQHQTQLPVQPVVYRQPTQRPTTQYESNDESRTRKPTVQILRKYRTDNPDGSITWGYENEDGTFKEETLGIDCVTKGKYGYTDPDGVRREYSYETGNKCDQPEEEDEDDLPPSKQPVIQGRKPQFRPQPQPVQYQ